MWSWSFAVSVLPQLLSALLVTVVGTVLGFALACVVGLLWALARRSRIWPLKWFAIAFVEFVRTTPLLVQLYFIFYVLPLVGISMTPLECGVLGLGLHYSTYLSEVYRAGIDGVPRGQWEAARALNLTAKQTWTRVILPQALPPIIPILGNYLLDMFKQTPLLSAITVVEMVDQAKIIGSNSFRYIEPFTEAGVLFLILSYFGGLLFTRLERRFTRYKARTIQSHRLPL